MLTRSTVTDVDGAPEGAPEVVLPTPILRTHIDRRSRIATYWGFTVIRGR